MRKTLAALGAVSLVSAGLLVTAGPANAYNYEGCQWPTGNIRYINQSGYSAATAAVGDWNASTAPVDLSAAAVKSAQIVIEAYNDGDTGTDGMTTWTCRGGRFVRPVYSHFNTYYTAAYSQDGRTQVMVHELGHAMGLAHAGGSTCSGGPIMYYSSDRYTVCHHVKPQADDINGSNGLY